MEDRLHYNSVHIHWLVKYCCRTIQHVGIRSCHSPSEIIVHTKILISRRDWLWHRRHFSTNRSSANVALWLFRLLWDACTSNHFVTRIDSFSRAAAGCYSVITRVDVRNPWMKQQPQARPTTIGRYRTHSKTDRLLQKQHQNHNRRTSNT